MEKQQYSEEDLAERDERFELLGAIRSSGRFKNNTKVIDVMRDVKENGYKRFRGYSIDSFSASAFLAVYDAANDDMKAKLLEFANKDLVKAIGICFQLCK